MGENTDFKIVAKTLYGLEHVLANELLNLGAKKINIGVRNVSFYGDKGFLYKSNLALRTALKILKPIAVFDVKGEKDLYSSFLNYNWEDFISIDDTFSIESVLNSDFLIILFMFLKKQKMVLLIDLENYSNQDQVLIPLILILKSIFILEKPDVRYLWIPQENP